MAENVFCRTQHWGDFWFWTVPGLRMKLFSSICCLYLPLSSPCQVPTLGSCEALHGYGPVDLSCTAPATGSTASHCSAVEFDCFRLESLTEKKDCQGIVWSWRNMPLPSFATQCRQLWQKWLLQLSAWAPGTLMRSVLFRTGQSSLGKSPWKVC